MIFYTIFIINLIFYEEYSTFLIQIDSYIKILYKDLFIIIDVINLTHKYIRMNIVLEEYDEIHVRIIRILYTMEYIQVNNLLIIVKRIKIIIEVIFDNMIIIVIVIELINYQNINQDSIILYFNLIYVKPIIKDTIKNL